MLLERLPQRWDPNAGQGWRSILGELVVEHLGVFVHGLGDLVWELGLRIRLPSGRAPAVYLSELSTLTRLCGHCPSSHSSSSAKLGMAVIRVGRICRLLLRDLGEQWLLCEEMRS